MPGEAPTGQILTNCLSKISSSFLNTLKRFFSLLRLHLTQKALQLPFEFFFLFVFLLVTFFERTAKSFLANALSLVIKKPCDQDLTHSLDTPKCISVKIVPQVVNCDAYGTWYSLCTVTSIYSIQKHTRDFQNRPPETRRRVLVNAISQNESPCHAEWRQPINLFCFLYGPLPKANKKQPLLFANHFSEY